MLYFPNLFFSCETFKQKASYQILILNHNFVSNYFGASLKARGVFPLILALDWISPCWLITGENSCDFKRFIWKKKFLP